MRCVKKSKILHPTTELGPTYRNDVPVCRDHRSAVGWSDFGFFFYTSHVVIHIKIFLPSSKKKTFGPLIDMLKSFRIWLRFCGDVQSESSNFLPCGIFTAE